VSLACSHVYLARSHVSPACSQRTAFPRKHPLHNQLEEEEAMAMTEEVEMVEVEEEVVEVEEEVEI
jgi:hypothetical protein